MGIFRRSRKKEHANPGPPSLPELSLPHNQSLPNLTLQYGDPGPLPSLAAGYGKDGAGAAGTAGGAARIDPTNGLGRAPSQKPGSVAGAGAGTRPQRSVSSAAGLGDLARSRTSSRATNTGDGMTGMDSMNWRQASATPIRQYHRPYTPQQGGAPESMQTFSGAMMSPSFSSPQMSTPGTSQIQKGSQQAFPSPASHASLSGFDPRPTSSASGYSGYSASTIPRNFRVSPSIHSGIGVSGGVTGSRHHSSSPFVPVQYNLAQGQNNHFPGVLHTATLSPDASRRAVDVARRMSLKKSKAPAKFNLLIVGGQGTGKTTFIRTLLDTLDLSACTPDVRRAIATFGTSAPSPTIKKYTYTHPLEPERTKKICMLSDIEIPRTAEMPRLDQIWSENISANAFYASADGAAAVDEYTGGTGGGAMGGVGGDESAYHGGGQDAESSLHGISMGPRSSRSRMSHASTSRSHAGTPFESNPSKRLVLSIVDAPGFSFVPGQEFELERALRKVLRQIEDKFVQSLAEESKVQRRRQADEHYHLVLYFIDPLRVVETEAPPSPARAKMQKEKRASKGKPAINGVTSANGQTQESAGSGMPPSQNDPVGLRRTNSGGALRSRAVEDASAAAVEKKPKSGARAATTVGHGASANDEPASESEGEEEAAVGQKSFLGMAPSPSSMMELLPSANGGGLNDEEEEEEEDLNEIRLRLSQQEKKIILRLSRRANVLPVLAKADLLTEQRCLEIKAAIRLSFQEMSLPAGPFMAAGDAAGEEEETEMLSTPTEPTQPALREHKKQGLSISSAITEKSEPDSETDASSLPPGGEPVKRIKLRSRRSFSKPSSERPDLPVLDHTPPLFADKQQEEEELVIPTPLTPKAESNQWPFTLILPEPERPPPPQGTRGSDILNGFPAPPKSIPPVPPIPPQHQAHARAESATSYLSSAGSGLDSQTGGAALLNGSSQQGASGPHIPNVTSSDPGRRFQRRYKWGAIDIFNPEHCDFTALRASILCHHVEALRQSTKVRYEEFRAERLQVRRETLGMSIDQRQALTKSLDLL